MERGTYTTIEELMIGDRFCLVNDRKRTVLEKVGHQPLTTKYYTYKNLGKADNEKHPRMFKQNTQVVFLRHKISDGKQT